MTQTVNCLNFEDRINDILDQRLPLIEDVNLRTHAAECTECESLLSDYISVETLFPTEAKSQVVEKASSHDRREERHANSRKKMIFALTCAASLMLAVGLAFNHRIVEYGTTSTAALISHFNETAPGQHIPNDSLEQSPFPASSSDSVANHRLKNFNPTGIDAALGISKSPGVAQSNVVDWRRLSRKLLPLNSYYQISAELPGMRPLQTSLGLTIDWFQQTFLRFAMPKSSNPGYGYVIEQSLDNLA